jgi:hypothetical protein
MNNAVRDMTNERIPWGDLHAHPDDIPSMFDTTYLRLHWKVNIKLSDFIEDIYEN